MPRSSRPTYVPSNVTPEPLVVSSGKKARGKLKTVGAEAVFQISDEMFGTRYFCVGDKR